MTLDSDTDDCDVDITNTLKLAEEIMNRQKTRSRQSRSYQEEREEQSSGTPQSEEENEQDDETTRLGNEADKLFQEVRADPTNTRKRKKLTTLLNKMVKKNMLSIENREQILQSC